MMKWDQRLIGDPELLAHLTTPGARGLSARAVALIEQQKRTWPMLAGGYRALAQVETRPIRVAESNVIVQHNPGRIRSTAASVDKTSVEARGCFLCPDSQPPEEKGIAYGDELVLLCNPFPVLDKHLSIVHRDHVPQRIESNMEKLLDLACDLGPDFFVLYNGPECGASAPDHLHFQACSRELLPIYSDLGIENDEHADGCAHCEEKAGEGFELFSLDNYGRVVVVFRGNRSDEIARWVYKTIAQLPPSPQGSEPMINIVCTYDKSAWTLFLFPRARHRPACFYAEGDHRLIVSPGAIDMAGVIVVPERAHYDRIAAEDVSMIFSEVSPDVEAINDLLQVMCDAPAEEDLYSGCS
ncbi:MAG TPA: DUF4922 domain-containing protein [Blastocatellia bacterium]|nr:DUF4922 domain-containing protein [Blastocatellia bacterium]